MAKTPSNWGTQFASPEQAEAFEEVTGPDGEKHYQVKDIEQFWAMIMRACIPDVAQGVASDENVEFLKREATSIRTQHQILAFAYALQQEGEISQEELGHLFEVIGMDHGGVLGAPEPLSYKQNFDLKRKKQKRKKFDKYQERTLDNKNTNVNLDPKDGEIEQAEMADARLSDTFDIACNVEALINSVNEIMEADGVSAAELSRRLGMDGSNLRNILKHKRPASTEQAVQMLSALGRKASIQITPGPQPADQ